MTVMMQKQVAERLIATPNDMSLLTVSAQFYGDPQIRMTLKPPVFYPAPGRGVVGCVHIDVYDAPPVNVPDEASFFAVVRAGFGQKRKQLKNSLAKRAVHLVGMKSAAMLGCSGRGWQTPRRNSHTGRMGRTHTDLSRQILTKRILQLIDTPFRAKP